MDSSYSQESLDSWRVRFTVDPASPPQSKRAANVIAVLFALLVIGTTPGGTPSFLVIFRFLVAVVGAWYLRKGVNRWFAGCVDKIRSPGGTFVVSPDGIEAPDGSDIPREQLHRLIVRNGVPDIRRRVVTANTGAMLTVMQSSTANDRAVNRTRALAVSYMLCAESGGRSTTLAGDMNEVTAHDLQTDVNRVLGPSAA